MLPAVLFISVLMIFFFLEAPCGTSMWIRLPLLVIGLTPIVYIFFLLILLWVCNNHYFSQHICLIFLSNG